MLVFSLRLGQAFYVGDTRVELASVNRQGVTLRVGADLAVPWFDMLDLPGCAGVRVCAKPVGGQIRVGVEAPLEIKILRERLYEASRQGRREPARGPRRLSINDVR